MDSSDSEDEDPTMWDPMQLDSDTDSDTESKSDDDSSTHKCIFCDTNNQSGSKEYRCMICGKTVTEKPSGQKQTLEPIDEP